MDEQRKRKIRIALIVLSAIFAVGLIVLGFGQFIPHIPSFIAGCVIAGASFIPLIIVAIIAYLKQC